MKKHKKKRDPREQPIAESFGDLLDRELPERQPIITNMLEKAASILVFGNPKSGKTSMLSALSVFAIGAIDLDLKGSPYKCSDSDEALLYFDFQMGQHNFKDSLIELAPRPGTPAYKKFKRILDDRAVRYTKPIKLDDGGEGSAKLETLIDRYGATLIITDTLEEMMPEEHSGSAQRTEARLGRQLTTLAHKMNVCIAAIYQANKKGTGDPVSRVASTHALVAQFDDTMLVDRIAGDDPANKFRRTIHPSGRNTKAAFTGPYVLERTLDSHGQHSYRFVGELQSSMALSPQQKAVYAELKTLGAAKLKALTKDGNKSNTHRTLRELIDRNLAVTRHGWYATSLANLPSDEDE